MASYTSYTPSSTYSPSLDLNCSGVDAIDLEEVMKSVGILPPGTDNQQASAPVPQLPCLHDLNNDLTDLWDLVEDPWAQGTTVDGGDNNQSLVPPPPASVDFLQLPIGLDDVTSVQAEYAVPSGQQQTTTSQWAATIDDVTTAEQTTFQSWTPAPAAPQYQYQQSSHQSQVPSFPLEERQTKAATPSDVLLFDLLESSNMLHGDSQASRGPSPCFSDVSSASSGYCSMGSSMSSSTFSEADRYSPPAVAPTAAAPVYPPVGGLYNGALPYSSTGGMLPYNVTTAPTNKRPATTQTADKPSRKRVKKEPTGSQQQQQQTKMASNSSSGSGKPPTPYFEMIARALMSTPSRTMILADVYEHILHHYPYFRTAPATWRNAVRHNLTVNDTFVKGQRVGASSRGMQQTGSGFLWSVHPACIEMFSSGDFRRMQARRLAQQSYKNGGTTTAASTGGDVKSSSITSCYQKMTYTNVSSAHSSIPFMPFQSHQRMQSYAAGM